ncbi:monoglyceride lipase [Senna tora]|uniref:Monoglyceride lipase n=1 Tax=Senna tora TaxID=362788 RepID=A0A834WPR7_9FABA|nr:monoglyceride lipase [Senna tora]
MASNEREMELLTSGASNRIIPILKTLRASLAFLYTFFFSFLSFILPRRRRLSSPVLLGAPHPSPSKHLKRRSTWSMREEEDSMRRRALAETVEMGIHDGWSRCSTSIFYGVRRNALFCRSWLPLSGDLKGILIIIHGLNEHRGITIRFVLCVVSAVLVLPSSLLLRHFLLFVSCFFSMAETPNSSSNQVKDGSALINSGSTGSGDSNSGFYRRDPLYLHPTDHTGLQLVSISLTSSNYMIWSRFMKTALKSKNKLGFVDGTCPKPTDENSDRFFQWSFADSTVTAWIVNSMSKDLAEAYVFTTSARRLWQTLEDKYGKAAKPQVFHIKKKLAAIKQNGESLAVYSTKLEKYWEELNSLEPKIRCSTEHSSCCHSNKQHDDRDSSNQVMQFLMGLDDCYDTVVNNILMLEPTPSYNKVYAIVATVESKKEVMAETVSSIEATALAVKNFEQSKYNSVNRSGSSGNKKDVKKGDRFCIVCNKPGHMEDTCFKKHGIPEWYTEYKAQKSKKTQSFSSNVSTVDSASQSSNGVDMSLFSEMIQKELQKFMKSKASSEEKTVNTSCFADFAGNVHSYSDMVFQNGNWIIDSGASSHISGDLTLFSSLRDVNNSNTVLLPDGTVKKVKHIGEVRINDKILLKEDLLNKEVLAVGIVRKHLYILNKEQVNLLALYTKVDSCSKSTLSESKIFPDYGFDQNNSLSHHTNAVSSPQVTSATPNSGVDVLVESQLVSDSTPPIIPQAEPRRPTRVSRKPTWLQDYVTCSMGRADEYTPKAYPFIQPKSCHGGSDGLHGYVPSLDQVVADTGAFLEKIKLDNPGVPCFLFGHSTGGAVVLKAASYPHIEEMLEGIVMTSPALGVKPSHPIVRAAAPVLSLVAPRFQFKGANKRGIPVSRDPAALVAKYSDPLVYTGPIRVRTGYEILQISSYLVRSFKSVKVPFFVLHGTADKVTDPLASQDLYNMAASEFKDIKLYDGFLHDLLFEPEREEIAQDIINWMERRLRTL